MWKALRLGGIGALVVGGTLALVGGPAVAAKPSATPLTCTGGLIQGGTYSSVTVTGLCGVQPGASITVVGNLNVAADGGIDAQVSSTITVGKNVTAGAGSFLLLGCQPPYPNPRDGGHPCEDSTTETPTTGAVTVDGNVTATDANTVLLNGITVDGQVTLTGGGGPIPWAEKSDTIGGNFTVTGVTADWFGALFDTVGRNATFTNITATDPTDPSGTPTVVIAGNQVSWNLNCSGIGPYLSIGQFSGLPNTAGRQATGQCAASPPV